MDTAVTLIFDLDGTISDPLVGIVRCVNYALAAHGLAEAHESDVAHLVGPPLDEVFRALLPDRDESRIPSLVAKYRERYAQKGYAENTLYDGVAGALANLHAATVRLGVCTSKRVDFAERILERFEIRALFSFVDGGDVGISKREQLKALLEAGRIRPDATMIGDRDVDVAAARANGLQSIGVLWGYGTQSELEQAGAGRLLRRTRDLRLLAACDEPCRW